MLPVQLLKENAQEERGETARLSTFVGAIAIGDLVRTTLGPKGMDKILVPSLSHGGQIQVTNDGATILKSIGVDNPAAKVLVDMAMTQDAEVGDGTTSVTVLASELLKEAEKLIAQKIHPQTIVAGYRRALAVAQNALKTNAVESGAGGDALRADLLKIAHTSLGSKILAQHHEQFSVLAVDAVLRLQGSGNLDAIRIIKKLGGSLTDSYLDEGFLLDKLPGMGQPRRLENAKILIANTPMDTDKVKVFGSRVRVDSVKKVADLEAAEKIKMKEKVEKIVASGCNVFINRQLIYNYPEQLFADAGVMAIEHADFEGIELLALVLGGEIVSTFDTPKDEIKFGSCKLIEEVTIGEQRMLRFAGVNLGEACTVVLRGSTQQILDEAERSLHDALCVLVTHVKNARTLAGAGAAELLMASAVQREADKVAGKEQHAVEAFARALLQLPTTIANNAGLDAAQLVAELRARHTAGKHRAGIDVNRARVVDDAAAELGVVESLNVKLAMVSAAAEAAEQLIRVDAVIKAAPRPRAPDRRPC